MTSVLKFEKSRHFEHEARENDKIRKDRIHLKVI